MKRNRDSDGNFERKLLDELKTVVAERAAEQATASKGTTPTPAWRRAPRLALGAVAMVAAAAVVLLFNSGGDNTPRAFAVEPQEGGGVTIEVYSLEDAAGLEEALEDAGIPAQVTWLPAGMVCREPHYEESVVRLPGGGTFGSVSMGGAGEPLTIGVGSTQDWRESSGKYRRGEISKDEMRDSLPSVNLDPEAFRPGQSVVLSGAPVPHDGDPEGGSIARMGVAEGPVEPCEPVPALPSGSGGFSAGGGVGYAPRGDDALSEAAVAADLRRTATAAEASEPQVEELPGPGQFLYAKTKVVQLQGWLPKGQGKGPKANPRYFVPITDPDARYALVPTLKEVWMAPDGKTREREALGEVEFLSDADQELWEGAGSPPPFAYDPAEHDVGRDRAGRPLKTYSSKAFRGRREISYLSRLSRLPTEPEALRLRIENRRGGSVPADPSPANSARGGATVERLLAILSEPVTNPALRAAAFNALAEIPGIGLERDVVDAAGRVGDAISWVRDRGFGDRLIFDPRTGEILAGAEMIFGAKAAGYPGVPDETVFRETAYLRSGVVGSTRERP